MDRRLLERTIGGVILLLALVLVVPAVLTGERHTRPSGARPPPPEAIDLRTHTITLEPAPEQPPVPQYLPPPEPPEPPEPPAPAAPAEARVSGAPRVEAPEAVAAEPVVQPAPPPAAAVPPPAGTRPEPARTTPALPPGEEGWVVQLGSFGVEDNARRLAGQVNARGFDAYVLPLKTNGRTLYRVRVGPPQASRAEAEALAARLAQAGHRDGQITRQ